MDWPAAGGSLFQLYKLSFCIKDPAASVTAILADDDDAGVSTLSELCPLLHGSAWIGKCSSRARRNASCFRTKSR